MPNTCQNPCPCQMQQSNPKAYDDCCQPYHQGAKVPDYESLMRSRFSAFVLGLGDYLAQTWHSSTRPVDLRSEPDSQWRKLEIIGAAGDQVHFKAYSQDQNGFSCMEEVSNFVEEDGRKVYVDGEVSIKPYTPQRNEFCLCGSGKKYKKCCDK